MIADQTDHFFGPFGVVLPTLTDWLETWELPLPLAVDTPPRRGSGVSTWLSGVGSGAWWSPGAWTGCARLP
jgi:hypothetical protein